MPSKGSHILSAGTVKVVNISKAPVPAVETLKLTVLVEDTASVSIPNLTARHGLSLLATMKSAGAYSQILMDAGPPPDIALQNARKLEVDLNKTNVIVISHGHYDHVGGLIETLKHIDHSVPVVAHPKAFDQKFIYRPHLKFVGPEFDRSSLGNVGGMLLLSRSPVTLLSGVLTSGEIPRKTHFEQTRGFYAVANDRFVEDPILDDQALFINLKGRGLVVIVGCAHAGIINTLRHARRIVGTSDIHAIVGGLHLAKADETRIYAVMKELARINPRMIYPCHCTGSTAINQLLGYFGDRCRPVHTGDTIEFQ